MTEPPHPTQLGTWLPHNFAGAGEPDIEEGEWLRCLKDTGEDERLIVWEGAAGRGLVAIVDFASQRSMAAAGVYEGWGRVQQLNPVIDRSAIASEPLLADRFLGARARGLQGSPKRLSPEEGAALARIAPALPSRALPVDEPTYDEEVIFWAGDTKGPPEAVLEHDIHTTRRLWKALGFPSAPLKQRRLPSGRRPDLIAPGVVADVKRRITRIDGPAQLENYLDELDVTRPGDGPWRGLLIHPHRELDKATRDRIANSSHAIEAWVIAHGQRGRREVKRLA
jgi:hypothetical protein